MTNKPANSLKKTVTVTPKTIISALAEAPEALFRAEGKRDEARIAYEVRLAEVSDLAINCPADGQEKRTTNETQRKIAIDLAAATDPDCKKMREDFESAQRSVNLCRARHENYQLIARLMLAQIK